MRFIIAICLLFSIHTVIAAAPVRLQFDRIPVVDLVQVVYSDLLKQNYVIDPKVTLLTDTVSVRFETNRDTEVKPVLQRLLNGIGIEIVRVAGVDFIALRPKTLEPSVEDDWQTFIYRVKYRDAGYLTELLSGLVKGRFSFQRAIQTPSVSSQSNNVTQPQVNADPTSARAVIGRSDFDVLIYTGPDVVRLESLLAQIDIPQPEVIVKAYLYEVSSLTRDSSALNILTKLLAGRIDINLGQSSQAGNKSGSWLSVDIGGLEVLASALSTDRRFKVLSSPSIRVTSGDTARIAVGNQVPVLGQFTTNRDGQLVQSVTYRSSGAILQVKPIVRAGNLIELNIDQQLSSFANTTTGVNNSPTLLTREVTSRMSTKSGEVVLFGGLKDVKNTNEKSGFSFLPFSLGKSSEDSESELLLMLEAVVL